MIEKMLRNAWAITELYFDLYQNCWYGSANNDITHQTISGFGTSYKAMLNDLYEKSELPDYAKELLRERIADAKSKGF